MNCVLSGLTGTRCFVYLDDIILYARSLADHNTKLREVLDRLRTYKLKLQPEKCEFLRKEVNYLGHQIIEAGPPKGSGNRAVSHTHYRETTGNFLWHD